MIISRTPFRASFFGGGTDYPLWFQEHGGAVLATAIDKYCYISCRYLPPFFEHRYRIVYSRIENVREVSEIQHPAVRHVLDILKCHKGLEIHHDADLPARSGLGSSSSFTVGLVNALMALAGRHVTSEHLASTAIHIEQDIIRENVGSQDQILAAYGGFNKIEFLKNGQFSVNPIILPGDKYTELENHLMLFFTGFSRIASEVARSKIENFKSRHNELKAMREMVDEAISILQSESRSICEFGELLHRNWQYKRSLSSKVSSPAIDKMYETARNAGAIGGKLLGAGGGGFLLLFAEPGAQAAVREKLRDLIYVPFKFEPTGSRIVLYQPNGLD